MITWMVNAFGWVRKSFLTYSDEILQVLDFAVKLLPVSIAIVRSVENEVRPSIGDSDELDYALKETLGFDDKLIGATKQRVKELRDDDSLGEILAMVAVEALRIQLKQEAPTSLLKLSVELAYNVFKILRLKREKQ